VIRVAGTAPGLGTRRAVVTGLAGRLDGVATAPGDGETNAAGGVGFPGSVDSTLVPG